MKVFSRAQDSYPITFSRFLRADIGSAILAIGFLRWGYSCTAPWWATCVGLVSFLKAISASTPLRSGVRGLTVGTVVSGLALTWLPFGLARASGCEVRHGVVLTFAAALLYGARFGAAAWIEGRCVLNGWPRGIGLVFGFTGFEAVAPGPAPWYLGAAVGGSPLLLQIAELLGPIGVSATLLVAAMSVDAMGRTAYQVLQQPTRARVVGLPWLVAFGAATGFDELRLTDRTLGAGRPIRVGIVQHNVPPEATANQQAGVDAVRLQVRDTWALQDGGAQLVVWPESSVSLVVPHSRVAELYPTLFTSSLGGPVVLGAVLGADDGQLYNAAISVGRTGELQSVYLKRILAPFGESVPGWGRIGELGKMFPKAHERPGPLNPEPFVVLGHRVSPIICIESLFPGLVGQSTSNSKSELIVELTNDAWFGNTWAPSMHLAATMLRAVENRRYVVRAAARGISAIVDPWGRLMRSTNLMVHDLVIGDVAWESRLTVFQTIGNLPWFALAVLAGGLSLMRRSA